LIEQFTAIGQPDRRNHLFARFVRHLRQPRAIGPYFPDFIFPAAIRDKGDPAAVRRPAWNDVLRGVIGKTAQRCASAVGGEEVLLWFATRKVNKALFIRREREKRV